MKSPETGTVLRVGCACGWEIVGSEETVVLAVLDHGERIHNMAGTREDVLANAERLGSTRPVPESGRPPTTGGA